LPFDRTFRANAKRASLGLAVLVSAAAATFGATHPAAAAGALQAIQNSITCSSGSACYLATNNSTGPGLAGTSSKGVGMQGKGVYGVKGLATTNDGVFGSTTSGYAGVAGTSPIGVGVYGYTTGSGGTAVYGLSLDDYGVYGATKNGNGTGVAGVVLAGGTGVYGYSNTSYGVEAESTTGYGLYAEAAGTGTAAYLSADEGGYGLIAYSAGSVAMYGHNSSGNGLDVEGTYIGGVLRAPASGGYPIVATDQNANDLFYVDGAGNVSYHGGLFQFARVPGGALVKSYSPKTTAPTVEDTGTAQLVGGAAAVRLDPTFAASVDTPSSYRVFITPNGDTRGLFVATKTPAGFIVRESQGGRSTVSFDYRIVATAVGQAGQRMAVANPASEPRATAPKVPHLTRASIPTALHP